ncbi:hypothetical protein AB6A40_003791 [Gnathostoma spinigerum]|uniref:Uncharacterized protein n=1 Tax=Gnathostoma spinigerum TaxID=75299 RepID=A0ABD6ECT4_9BILA
MLKSQTIIRKRRPKGSGKTLTEILDHYPSTSVHSREHSALSNDTSSLSELLCSASSYSQPVSTVPKKITRDSTIYLQSFAWNDTSNSKKMISNTSDMSTEESARVPKEDLSAVDSAQATSAAANAPSSLSEEVNVVFNSQVDHIHADEMATLANVFATTPEIPCHLCGSKMKLTMRKMRYKDAFKEYPGYRCCKKGCQTFRSPRSLLKSYTILVNQMKGQATENYYIPSPLQIKQLEVAFPGEVTSSLEPEESSTEIDAPLSPCTSSKESDERALQLMFPDEQSDDEYDDLKCQLDFVNPKQRCFDKLKAIASESSAKGLQKKSRCDSGLPTGHSQFCGTSVASKVLSPPPSLMRESQETTDGSSISKESSDIPATNGKVISSSPYKKKSQSHLVKGERRRATTLNSSEESFPDECTRKVPKDGSVSPPPLKKWNFRDRAGGEDEEATNDPDHDCEEAKLAIADEDEVSLKDPSLALIIDESASSPPVQKGRDPGRIILHCSEEMIL